MPFGAVEHSMVYTVVHVVVCEGVAIASCAPGVVLPIADALSHSPHGSVTVIVPVDVMVSPLALVVVEEHNVVVIVDNEVSAHAAWTAASVARTL